MRRVIAPVDAHVSVEKAARLLGLPLVPVPVGPDRRLDPARLADLGNACLVLTAGTTATGAIDDLTIGAGACWCHVDAAWAGPLRFSASYGSGLDGVELANSVAISGHKLLFQPKGSALILFKRPSRLGGALAFGGGYLAQPNFGIEGSRGAAAIPLLATLMAWGRRGLVERIDRCMALASRLEALIATDPRFTLLGRSDSGVVVFRPAAMTDFFSGDAGFSRARLDGVDWLRAARANPVADLTAVLDRLEDPAHLKQADRDGFCIPLCASGISFRTTRRRRPKRSRKIGRREPPFAVKQLGRFLR